MGSDDYGRDLTGVQNLKKKHKRLETELASHEPAIQAVQEAAEKLMDVSNLGVPEIEQVGFKYNLHLTKFRRDIILPLFLEVLKKVVGLLSLFTLQQMRCK